jgi:hypothetical protein
MKRYTAILILPLIVISFIGLFSCKNRAKSSEQKKVELEQVKAIESQIEENVYPLPTSASVIKMLTELQVGYIIGISNPVDNVKKYFSSASRSVNLGVYGADLSYATLYNQQQEVINYLNSIRILANELNMAKIYDESLYDLIKNNYDNRDELVKILTKAFNDTYVYLNENGQQALALLVVGGAWVEGIYLTTHVSEAAYQVAGISKTLLEQKKSFELLLDISGPFMSDPLVGDFIKLLDPVKEVYKGIGTSLTDKNIVDITKAIEGVRAKIIL